MNTKNRFQALVSAAFIAMVFFSIPALAQDQPADTMEMVQEKIRADKKLFVAQNMQLSESDAKAFWPVYEDFQKELEKQVTATRRLVEKYAANYQTMTDETARQIVQTHMDIQADRLKLLQSYLPKFRKALPEKKVARYYQLENKISASIAYQLAARIPLVK
jgi:hypothetical protein